MNINFIGGGFEESILSAALILNQINIYDKKKFFHNDYIRQLLQYVFVMFPPVHIYNRRNSEARKILRDIFANLYANKVPSLRC